MISNNPFNTGSPARGDGFFDREEIIDDVILFLKKTHEYNFIIFGQRRIGKTSLLRKLQDGEKLCDLAYPVYFNLQDKARSRLPQLLFEIAQGIATDLDLKIKVKENDFKDEKGPPYFKDKFLPAVCADLKDSKQLLLLFDEFDVLGDEIEDVEEDAAIDALAFKRFIPFMVSLIEDIQQKKYPVKFVFAVGRNYKDLDPKRYGQVIKFGPQREISYFSKKETIEFLKKNAAIPFADDAVAEIFRLTSGHPYFTQCLASAAFDHAEKKGNETITGDVVGKEFIPTIKSFSSGVYWVWDSLSAHDQIILYLMALLKEDKKTLTIDTIRQKAFSLNFAPAVEKLTETLDRLKSFKFIKETGKGKPVFEFYVEFIRKWIVREVTETEIAKKLPDIDEEIEHHLHNARYYFRHENHKEAAGHYEQILEKSPYHFEALLYLARSYKNLIDEDKAYLEKAITSYLKAFQINQKRTKNEYLNLLTENRKYLEDRGLYEKFKPEKLQRIIEEIPVLKIRLAELEKIKEKCDKLPIEKLKTQVKKISTYILKVPLVVTLIIFSVSFSLLQFEEKTEQNTMSFFIVGLLVGGLIFFILSSFVLERFEDWLEQQNRNLKEFHGFDEEEYRRLKEELDEAEKLFAYKI